MKTNTSITGEFTTPIGRSGFSARLKGAALFDLIQFECLTRSHKVVRVVSEGRTALLFFREGRIVHAVTGGFVGEAAVFEVVTWSEGVFEPWETTAPETETISVSGEHLLLRAAQAADHARATGEPALPASDGEAPASFDETPTSPHHDVVLELTSGRGGAAVRLSPSGEVSARHGADSETFTEAVAYANRIANMMGSLLGLDRCAEIDLTLKQGQAFLLRLSDGSVLAVRPGEKTSVEELRNKLGLAPPRRRAREPE
jgi:hypothetical protein